jgi:hypothetical protein
VLEQLRLEAREARWVFEALRDQTREQKVYRPHWDELLELVRKEIRLALASQGDQFREDIRRFEMASDASPSASEWSWREAPHIRATPRSIAGEAWTEHSRILLPPPGKSLVSRLWRIRARNAKRFAGIKGEGLTERCAALMVWIIGQFLFGRAAEGAPGAASEDLPLEAIPR